MTLKILLLMENDKLREQLRELTRDKKELEEKVEFLENELLMHQMNEDDRVFKSTLESTLGG